MFVSEDLYVFYISFRSLAFTDGMICKHFYLQSPINPNCLFATAVMSKLIENI